MGEPVTGSIVFHFGKPIAANALYAGVFSTGGGKGDENAWETSIFKMIKKPALLCTARTFNDGESFQFSLPVHKEIIEYCKGQLNPPPYDNQIERLKWDIIYRNPRKWLVEATLKTDKSSISNTVGFKIGTGSSGKKS